MIKKQCVKAPFYTRWYMKYITLTLILLFWRGITYAQAVNFSNPAQGNAAAIRQNIDHLNSVAHDIFLAFPDSAHKLAR